MTDQTIEQEIQAKGLTAPRITPADVEANIVGEHYFTAEQGVEAVEGAGSFHPNKVTPNWEALSLLTFCVLVLRNGFTVTGESACASPENFNAEIGRKIARANAVQKVWPLMRSKLTDEQIIAIADNARAAESGDAGYILPIAFARAIEAAHGIGGNHG